MNMAKAELSRHARALRSLKPRKLARNLCAATVGAATIASALSAVVAAPAQASARPISARPAVGDLVGAPTFKPKWGPELTKQLAAYGATIKPPASHGAPSNSLPNTALQAPSSASAFSSTYKEPDGSFWTEYSSVPLNYRGASGHWQRIDTTLHEVPGHPGNYASGSDTWHATFGPLPAGGVEIYSGGHHLHLVPDGAADVSPEVDPTDPSRVVYKDAWPGADLAYTVTSAGIKEDILLKDPSAPTAFTFSTPGAALGHKGHHLAGPDQGLPPNWYFVAPQTTDRHGRVHNGAGADLVGAGEGATVLVDAAWLHTQPASEFPIDLDPSVGYDVNGIPPWQWDGSDAAVFCLGSDGYTGHPSSGSYTTCTLPSGDVGAKVGFDGSTDWQTELAFDIPSSSTIQEPPGCDSATVGTAAQPANCIVVQWAQLGLGTGSGQENSSPGYLNVFAGKTDYTYGDVGPDILASTYEAPYSGGASPIALRARASGTDFPCGASSGQAASLGDLYQDAACGTTVPYITVGASASSGGTGSSSSTAFGCNTATGSGCGPFQSFQLMNFWVHYDYAATPPTQAGPANGYISPYDDAALWVNPGADADGDNLSYDFLIKGNDGSQRQSGWTSSLAWDFPVDPGVSYTWTAYVYDGSSVTHTKWSGTLAGPDGSPQDAPAPLFPQGGPLSADQFGGWDPSGCDCGSFTAVPDHEVLPSNGDLVESSSDISVPGAGMPLSFDRTYDSLLAQQEVSSGSAPGPLGYGWSYNLGMTLSQDPTTGVVTVHQENGSEVSFSPYDAGTSPSWCLAGFNYCADAARVLATLEHNADGTWTLTRHVGGQLTTFDFSSSGQLSSQADQAGDQLSASTTAPGTGQCPASAGTCTTWASSASGRSLTLAFNSAGQLTSVSDQAGNTVTYCSYGQACAGGASTGGSQDLYSATVPGQGTTIYSYDTANPNPDLAHDILAESLPDGSSVTNTFDASGRVTAQDEPNDDVTLSYQGDNSSVAGGSTTVGTWPSGTVGQGTPEVTRYYFSSGAMVAETTGYGTPSAATQYFDLDRTAVVPTKTQDANSDTATETLAPASDGPMAAGNVTSTTDALGNASEAEYNPDNQVWCTVGAAQYLAGVRCPSIEPTAPPAPGASDPWPGATVNFYDANGHLTAISDPLGRTSTYSYTPTGLSVPAGLQYCSVAPAQYAAGVTCPAYGAPAVKGTTSSTFDAAGDVTSTTSPDGATTTTAYTDPAHPGLPTVTTSPDGDVTTQVYDSAGQVVSSTVSFRSYKATTLYAYDSTGRLYCTVAPQQVAAGVTCPASPPSPSSPPAGVSSTFYDASGNVVQTTAANGATTQSAYDAGGRQWCSVAAPAYEKGVRCPATEPATAPSAGNDPYLGATITTYNSLGQVAQVVSPLGAVTSYTYDAAGNMASQTLTAAEPSVPAVTTTYSYDADDRQVSQTVAPGTALASTTLSYYNPDGNVYCSVSADAYASGNYSCPAWQPAWALSPPPVGALYSSNPTSSQADNVTTSFYDADGEMLQSTSPDKGTSVSVYDANGDVVCAETPADMVNTLGANPSASYPYACPPVPATTPPATGSNPGYETTSYDAAGRELYSSDAAGDTTSYTYDLQGQVLTTTGPSGEVTTNCYYWEVASCAASAPANGGAASDLYATTMPPGSASPAGATSMHTYLPGGVTSTTTNAAGTSTDTYDASGQLVDIGYSASAAGYSPSAPVSYTYDPAGLETSMTDGTGTTTYSYDAAGDLLSQSFSPATPACYVCIVGPESAVSAAGSGSVAVRGPMAVTSVSPSSVVASGTAHVSASPLDMAGGESVSANATVTGATTPVSPVPGNVLPLLAAVQLTGTAQTVSMTASTRQASPGVYSSISLGGNASLALAPGTYVLTGPLSVTGTAKLTGSGVVIYLACAGYPSACSGSADKGGSIAVSGNGTLAISGAPVGRASDVAIYADPAGTGGFSVGGSGVANITGSLDLPAGPVSASGNGSLSVSAGIVAAGSLASSGSATVTIDQAAAPALTGTTTSYSYLSTGQLAGETYPYAPAGASATVGYAYDARGDVASQTDWSGQEIAYGYDADGNLTSTAYPNGVSVVANYDLGGAMTAMSATSGATSLGASTYSLDSAEQLTNESDTGALAAPSQPSTSYTYDSADRLGSVTKPSGSAVASYDLSGDPIGLADGNTQSFDKAAELVSATTPKGTSTVYSYSSVGERASATLGTGGYSAYGYDQSGQMTSAHLAAPATTYPASVLSAQPLAYWRLDDPVGATSAADDSGNGHSLKAVGTASFGVPGALAGDPATSVSLDGAGSYLTATASSLPDFSGNAPFSIEAWAKPSLSDANQRAILSKVDPTGSGYELFTQGGNVGIERCANGICDIALSSSVLSSSTFTDVVATYDGTTMRVYLNGEVAASARSRRSIPDLSSSASIEVGAPGGFAGSLQEVAAYGSGLSANQVQAQYIAGSSPAPSTAVDYNYSNGLMQARTAAAGTANYTWDNSSLPLMLSDGSTNYLYGPSGAPVEQVNLASATTEYYVSDRQESTHALVSAGGGIDATFSYDAYGNLTSSTGTATTPLLYGGQYWDATTGFYYLRARWYDAVTTSFVSVDPDVSLSGQAYIFAADNSLMNGDPTGLLCSTPFGAIGQAIAQVQSFGRELNSTQQSFWQQHSCINKTIDDYWAQGAGMHRSEEHYPSCGALGTAIGYRGGTEVWTIHGSAGYTQIICTTQWGCLVVGSSVLGAPPGQTPQGQVATKAVDAITSVKFGGLSLSAFQGGSSGGSRTSQSGGSGDWPVQTGGNCMDCAVQIQKSIGGDIYTISPKPPASFLGPSVNNPDGDWTYHAVVIKNGDVYDSFSKDPQTGAIRGTPLDDYLEGWSYADQLDVFPIGGAGAGAGEEAEGEP